MAASCAEALDAVVSEVLRAVEVFEEFQEEIIGVLLIGSAHGLEELCVGHVGRQLLKVGVGQCEPDTFALQVVGESGGVGDPVLAQVIRKNLQVLGDKFFPCFDLEGSAR